MGRTVRTNDREWADGAVWVRLRREMAMDRVHQTTGCLGDTIVTTFAPYRVRWERAVTLATNDQETRLRASWATCCQRGLGVEFELAAFHFLEPGVLALGVYLAQYCGIKGCMRGLPTGRFPIALRRHGLDHRGAVHRGAGLAENLRGRVEGAYFLFFLGLRGLRLLGIGRRLGLGSLDRLLGGPFHIRLLRFRRLRRFLGLRT